MATKKVKLPAAFNAKPVTKLGGGSAPARNPSTPYKPGAGSPRVVRSRLPLVPTPKPAQAQAAKPAAKPVTRQSRVNGRLKPGPDTRPSPNTRASAKPAAQPAANTTLQKLQEAAKTKPNSPAPRSAPAAPSSGAASTAANVAKGASKLSGLGRILGPAAVIPDLAVKGNSIFNPNSQGNQQLAKAMAAVNQRYSGKNGPRFKNPNSGSVASKGSSPTASFNEKAYASQQKFDVPKPKAKPVAPKPPAASSTASRSSSGSNSYSGSSRPSVRAATAAKKTAPGQSGDMNANYRSWAAANPTLAAKVKKGQVGYNAFAKDAVAGMGPVRDSSGYKPSVSNSDTASTTPDKDKKKRNG
jgi:hypothetical protein